MKKKPVKPDNNERWLLTYSDLITLLMVLFVILYASSNVDTGKYKQLATSFRDALNITPSGGEVGIIEGDVINSDFSDDVATDSPEDESDSIVITEQQKLEQVKAEVDNLIAQSGLNSRVVTKIEEKGLVISFTDSIFFDSGTADVKEDYKRQLIEISRVLNKIDNYIRVEGHTDNVAIKTNLFNSNWQLSAVRAANVVEIFINQCGINPNKLSAIGYGEFRPIQTNDTEAGRAANRRVDIVILNSKSNQAEIAK